MWKDIKGYEGYYQVSDKGEIKSVTRNVKRGSSYKPVNERILRPYLNKGYLSVVLSKNGKTHTVEIHRVVAETFIPNPNNYPCVNHKDEITSNNCVSNLEWCTYSYNLSYNEARIKAAVSKRKPILQYDLDGNFIREWSHAREASEFLGINKRAIYGACTGRLKTSGGYRWKRKPTA